MTNRLAGCVLLATLGINPQVVTISLDLLQARGYAINQVITVYTDEARIKDALAQLDVELRRLAMPHRPVLITGDAGPISDFWSEADVTALLQTLYREVKTCKQQATQVHMMIAGGRKVMSAYALVVAQLLFDEDDRAWHLFSDFWLPGGDPKMHLDPNDQALLVPVPVLRWSPTAALATDLALTDNPWEVINRQQELQQREKDLYLRVFLNSLSKAQQAVAYLMAEGLDNNTMAARRHTSVSTITKQVSDIYGQWRAAFGLPESMPVRADIVAKLSAYLTRQGRL